MRPTIRGGFAKQVLGRHSEAVSDYAKAFFLQGEENRKIGWFENAAVDYGIALKLAPDDASAYLGRGEVYSDFSSE